MKNIYFICQKNSFKYSEDYINSLKSVLNYKILLYLYKFNLLLNDNDIYIFIKEIPTTFQIKSNMKNIYLFNTEQMCKKYDNWATNINYLPKNVKILDFSAKNLEFYDKKFQTFFLPYQINMNEIYNRNKTKDICIIASKNGNGTYNFSENRKYIIDKLLSHNIKVDIISGFGIERDLELFKYKIILNIGWSKCAKIFESFRCDRCIFNKMIIISDDKLDKNTYHLKKYIIFEKYENIPNKVKYILQNYKYIYNELYNNFSLEQIKIDINNISINTLKHFS